MFLKLERWWVYKIAGGLLTATLLTVYYKVPVTILYWQNLSLLFAAFISLAIFGHFINDLSDLRSDRLSGKSNLVETTGKKNAVLVLFTSMAMALVFISNLENRILLALVGVQIAFNLLYSVRPIRLKERGVLALLVTGCYERSLPYLIIAVLLVDSAAFVSGYFLVFYLLWSFLWEVRNFIKGQSVDRDLDLQTGQKTISIVMSYKSIQSLQFGLFLLEIIFLFLWMVQFETWWMVVSLSAVIGIYFFWRDNNRFRIERTEVFKVVDDAYNLSFPVLFAMLGVITYSIELLPILVVLIVAFNNHFRLLFLIIVRNIDWQKWLRWLTYPYRMLALGFNWVLYYFRKWVLNWSEERNWGKHYAKHLRDEQLRKSKQENER